jgi:excisionase family DNA binding protein
MNGRLEAAVMELVAALREELAPAPAADQVDAPERIYSVEQAAELLAVGRTFLFGEIARGNLRTLKAGRRRLVPASSISDYARGQR